MRIREQDQNRIGLDFQRTPPHPPTMMPRTDADAGSPRLGEAFRSGLPFIDSPIQTALRGVDPATLSPLEQALYQKPYGLLDSEPFVPREGPEQVMNVLGMSVPIAAGGAATVPGRLAFPAFATEMGIARLGEEGHQRGLSGLGQMIAEGAAGMVAPGTAGGLALKHAVIPAFHGTPHRWGVNPELGRVGTDMSKMSTGEGNQAFGYGHYSADAKDVAKGYQEAGWSVQKELQIDDGRIIPVLQRSNLKANHETIAAEALNRFDGDRKTAIDWLGDPEAGPMDQEAAQFLRDNPGAELIDRPASTYGLLHDVNPEDLLDLDLPLSKQSEKVRKGLERAGIQIPRPQKVLDAERAPLLKELVALEEAGNQMTPRGSELRLKLDSLAREHNLGIDETTGMELVRGRGKNAIGSLTDSNGVVQDIHAALADAGIPGSQFYDGMSRNGSDALVGHLEIRKSPDGKYNVTTEAGTQYGSFDTREAAQSFADAGGRSRNYVMFRDDLTYVDPARTDAALIGDMEVGAPYRTVDQATPAPRAALPLMGGEGGIAKAAKRLLRGDLDPMSYSGTRLDRPIGEVNVGIDPTTPNAPRQELNFEDLEGDYLLPLFGDRSARGGNVTSIDGEELANPVYREGGPDFMVGPAADQGSIWASDQGIITRLQNRANQLGQGGEGVAGVTVAMGPQAVDFTGFAARVAAEQIPGAKITKKAKRAFDVEMKKVDSGWPGVDSVGLSAYLEAAPPLVRKHFMRVMDKAPQQKAGFPSVGKARRAVTEPDLYDTPTGSAGFAVGRLNPGGAPITDPSVPHGTYDTQMAGEYLGGLPQQLPKEVLWRDFYRGLEGRRTKAGKPLSPAQKKYIMNLEMPGQRVDAALVDTVMELLRKQQP